MKTPRLNRMYEVTYRLNGVRDVFYVMTHRAGEAMLRLLLLYPAAEVIRCELHQKR